MADDETDNTFHTRAGQAAVDAAKAAGTALAAIAAGIALRVQDVLALADDAGQISIEVDSTCVAELRYDTLTGTMGITFQDGGEYDYPDVSRLAFTAFVNAPSKGQHYNLNFRGLATTQFAGSKKQRIKIGRRR